MQPEFIPTDDSADSAHRDMLSNRHHAVVLARWISLGLFGLIVCVWLAILVSTYSEREATLGRVNSSASNLSAAFGEQVFNTLNTISAAMDLIAGEIRADPTGFRLDRWSQALPALARPTMFASLIGVDGKLITTSIKPGVNGTDMGDLGLAKVQRALVTSELYVGEPFVGPASGRAMIRVSRRIDDADGHDIGTLVFTLAADGLTTLHRSVDLGPRGVIALIGTDGRVRARFGDTPEGTPSVPGGPWPIMPDQNAPDRNEMGRNEMGRNEMGRNEMGTIVRSDVVDGVSRVYSLRHLAAFPLIVAAGLSLDDELAVARSHAILEVGIGIAATVLLAALNILLVREIRRRRQRETELALERTALESARTELLIEQGKLATVNQELIYSTEQAEAANHAKSQFLAQMSHELRTPLHAVIGFSELISHHVSPMPASREIAGYANDIMKSGRHLLALINSILDLSKVESGTARLAEDDVPLDEVIQDSVTTIRQLAVAANVTIETSLPPEMPTVRGDATKLRQIFINLLSNAVKFTPQGGSITVLGRHEQDRGFAVIVSDTGIGMSEAELAVALEPFGQVENSLSRTFEGTGLGLPLAHRMAELHGGRLTLRSVKGVGTSVEVYLPASRILWPDGARKPQDAPVASER